MLQSNYLHHSKKIPDLNGIFHSSPGQPLILCFSYCNIKNKDILFPYLEGLEMNLKKPEIESFKKKAAVHALRSYIKNGSKNNINITYEKKCLKQLLS